MKKETPFESQAFLNFKISILDAAMIRAVYDDQTKKGTGVTPQYLEVLKRAGIIVSITAWETYIEDSITAQFEDRIKKASHPSEIQSAFNLVAQEWLGPTPKPPDLAKWATSGWKDFITSRFKKDIEGLNTPNSANIKKLTNRYLGFDLTQEWKWRGTSPEQACQRLDKIIQLRGGIVHRGRFSSAKRSVVSRRQLIGTLTFITRLVLRTERTFIEIVS